MSAFVVGKPDIDLIVSALRQFKVFVRFGNMAESAEKIDPNDLGQMLWSENVKSVAERYRLVAENPGELARYDRDVASYLFEEYPGIKAGPFTSVLRCYEYQSCEHDGWDDSDAKRAVDRLYKELTKDLPNSAKGPWGIGASEDIAKVCSIKEPAR